MDILSDYIFRRRVTYICKQKSVKSGQNVYILKIFKALKLRNVRSGG